MLLTITTTQAPATDLGYLLAKNPARAQVFELGFGRAHVVYPEASAARCTAALLLEVDPVGLSRGRRGAGGPPLEPYVNDRPYVASSFLSVAIGQVFGSALAGRSRERPELAAAPIPLRAHLPTLPCRGGEAFLRSLFAPLGYAVEATRSLLDARFPEWGDSPYLDVTLAGELRLSELLGHLYVLVPVLDDRKHYWVGEDELEKLLRHGQGWLERHPQREAITRRYLKHRRGLVEAALARLTVEEQPDPEAADEAGDAAEASVEAPLHLNQLRLEAVLDVLRTSGARRVLDLGCGEGNLLRALLREGQFETIVGLDVSHRALEVAAERLHLDRMSDRERARIQLLHGSLTYRDRRLDGYDAAAIVEVIEHLDPPRLEAFGRAVFGAARPATVVLTTPNAEYNAVWLTLPAGHVRHPDHRFEWTRAEFRTWAEATAQRFGYQLEVRAVGPDDPSLGAPTQMGVFRRG
jgi:3' terminal RNA ribose 2'-O-methyltransferase Hen1